MIDPATTRECDGYPGLAVAEAISDAMELTDEELRRAWAAGELRVVGCCGDPGDCGACG